MVDEHHPVWVVYDLYKTARLNVKYYAARLNSIERQNFFIELIIAIAAPTSAITGIWLLKTDAGQELWKYVAGVAAFAAELKPVLKLPAKIKLMEQCLAGYRSLEYDVAPLCIDAHNRPADARRVIEKYVKHAIGRHKRRRRHRQPRRIHQRRGPTPCRRPNGERCLA